MQSEIETNSSERYLVCNNSVSNKMLENIKLDVANFMAIREKDESRLLQKSVVKFNQHYTIATLIF